MSKADVIEVEGVVVVSPYQWKASHEFYSNFTG